jgi:LmbE family N-acetylglucosaminyl deacetylase
MLGATSIVFGRLPDNRFDAVALLDVVKRVEAWLAEVAPAVVYTHHPGDLNIDHRITFEAVLTAARPVPGCAVRELYAFEVPSSTEWAFQQVGPPFRPSVFEDVTETIDLKVRCLERYRGEARPFPHPRSGEALRAIARRWGSVAGLAYAEAFELVRSVR